MDDNNEQAPPVKFEASVLQVVLEESEKMATMTSLALLDEEREKNYALSSAARTELVTTYMSLKALALLLTDFLSLEGNIFIEDGISYVLLEDAEFINIMNAVTMSNEGRVLLKSFYNISLSSH